MKLPKVVLAGQFQSGKSTFVNCALNGCYAHEGDGLSTTTTIVRYRYGAVDDCKCLGKTIVTHSRTTTCTCIVNSNLLKQIELIDIPGWDANGRDDRTAVDAMTTADYVVYVTQAALKQSDYTYLRNLVDRGIYFSMLLNCMRNPVATEDSQNDLCDSISGWLSQNGFMRKCIKFPTKNGIGIVNLKWAKYGLGLCSEKETVDIPNELSFLKEDKKAMFDVSGFEKCCKFVKHAAIIIDAIAANYNIQRD